MNNKMIILTHGDIGQKLKEVAKKIIGEYDESSIIPMSNENLSASELVEKLNGIVKKDENTFFIIATDFPGGSCFLASKKIASSNKKISTVSGLNISMILSFLTKKESCEGSKLAEIIRTDGNRAIVT